LIDFNLNVTLKHIETLFNTKIIDVIKLEWLYSLIF